MKNLSLLVNAVLVAAVAFLYYKVYSGNGSPAAAAETASADSLAPPVRPLSAKTLSDLPENSSYAFINADTIFKYYEYAIKIKSASEGRVSSYRRTYQQKADELQQQYNDYMEKAGKGMYTREQGEAIEADLTKKRDDLAMMEMNQSKVLNEIDNSTLEVNRKIYDFLTRFNREHGYQCILAFTYSGGGVLGINDSLDITSQVIDGLNAEYNATKK